jgi:hypothetical protein
MAERKSILLRLDPAVHDALAKWAADEMRSTNAQIEFLLRRALGDAGRMPGSARQMRRPGRPAANADAGGSANADANGSGDANGSANAEGSANAGADGSDE